MNVMFLNEMGINPIAGGISRMTSVLSSGLKSKGVNVFYLSMIKLDGVDYDNNQFFFPDSDVPMGNENANYLIQFVREKTIDILINQATTSSIYRDLSFVVKHRGVKIISVIHNSLLTPVINFSALKENRIIDLGLSFLLPLTKNKLFISLLKNLYRFKYQNHYKLIHKNSDRVILVSEKNIQEFLYMVNVKKSNKVIAISNSFSLPEYQFKKTDKKKEVLWVGTPDFSIKRIDLALRVWGLIEESRSDWNLTILGDSPSLQKAKNLANKLNLSSVKFIGRQNPNDYYKRASMLIMTSTTESFGLVLVEAMHFGVVPFAFDSFPASKDIIKNEKSGFLIKSFDINLYAKKIAELIEDSKKRYIISQNSITKSKDFNIDVIIKQWINLLNSL